MALMARLLSLSGLQAELGRDRRSLGKILQNIPPDGKTNGGRDAWFIKTVLDAVTRETSGEQLNPAAEKARLDKARADLAELDLRHKEGRSVPADLVQATWGRIRDEIRKALFAVPGKCAPRILPGMKPSEIEALIREYIDDALRALSSAEVKTEEPHDDSGSEPSGAT